MPWASKPLRQRSSRTKLPIAMAPYRRACARFQRVRGGGTAAAWSTFKQVRRAGWGGTRLFEQARTSVSELAVMRERRWRVSDDSKMEERPQSSIARLPKAATGGSVNSTALEQHQPKAAKAQGLWQVQLSHVRPYPNASQE